MEKPSYLNFDKENYPWKPGVDYRKEPQRYKIGKEEQGVLICEPYKSEIGKFWKFREPEIEKESSAAIYRMFESYLSVDDFVGADRARKYLQMGFYKGQAVRQLQRGTEYDKASDYTPPERRTGAQSKAESVAIFFAAWKMAEANDKYRNLKLKWKNQFG